jgi:hypothetical protein
MSAETPEENVLATINTAAFYGSGDRGSTYTFYNDGTYIAHQWLATDPGKQSKWKIKEGRLWVSHTMKRPKWEPCCMPEDDYIVKELEAELAIRKMLTNDRI